MSQQRPPTTSAQLAIIRIGLLMGVLVFGGVSYVRNRNNPGASGPTDVHLMRNVGSVIIVAAIAGIIVIRTRLDRARDEASRISLAIAGWSFGEMAALFGAVYFFLVGDSRWFAVGLVVLLASFMLIPVRGERAR